MTTNVLKIHAQVDELQVRFDETNVQLEENLSINALCEKAKIVGEMIAYNWAMKNLEL